MSPTSPMEIDTARLRLRAWRPADAEPFAALNADPRVMAHFPAVLSREASDALLERLQSQIATLGWGIWAVERRDTRQFIGFTGLQTPAQPLPFSPCVEIGWRLGFEHWGQGLAREAAQAALWAGFEGLQLQEIVAFTAVVNQRSQALMRRLGMQPAAVTFEHPAVAPSSPLREHCLYRLDRARWLDALPASSAQAWGE